MNATDNQVKTILGSLFNLFTGQGARQGYLAAADQAVISLSNFAATIILARNVDPTQLGVYGVGFVTLRLVRAFQDGLIVQPMNVFGAGMSRCTIRELVPSPSQCSSITTSFQNESRIGDTGYLLTQGLISLWRRS